MRIWPFKAKPTAGEVMAEMDEEYYESALRKMAEAMKGSSRSWKYPVLPQPNYPKWEDYTVPSYTTNYEDVPAYKVPAYKYAADYDTVHLPPDLDWVKDYLDIDHWEMGYEALEIVGLIHVKMPETPASDMEAAVALFSRWRAFLTDLRKRETPLVKLPSFVLGQVANGYQAQVTLLVVL